LAEKKEQTKDLKEKKSNYLPEDEHDELLAKINRQAEKHPVVAKWHNKWKELIAWTDLNEQFSEWGDTGLSPVEFRHRKKKVVVNLMKPLSEAIEGKIDMTYSLAGLPNSGEISDARTAEVSTKLLAHNDYENDIEVLNEDIKYDLTRTGNAFKKIVWSKNKSGKMKSESGELTDIAGEVSMSVPDVFNMRPDPTALRIPEDCGWFVELEPVTYEWLMDNFELTEKDINRATTDSGDQDKFVGMHVDQELVDKEEKTAVIKRYWERKSEKYKNGRFFIVLGNMFIWKGPNKELGEIPFYHYYYKKSANTPWGIGPMFYVQDLQREFNRTVSMISEHIEAWKPKMVAEEGAITKTGAFTNDIAEILEIAPGSQPPHPISMPELSQQVMMYRDFIEGGFGKVSNVHEVSYSQLPKYASRAPASLFSMMLEQENVKLDPMIRRMNQTIIKEGNFRLRLMDKYYKQERLVKVVGRNAASTVDYFKGADLKGNFDVKLSIGVSLHQSKTILQRLIIELKQNNVLTDKDNNKILKLLHEGDLSEELRGDLADEMRALRENQAFINETDDLPFEEGGVQIYEHDDNSLHLDYHTNLRKSEEVQGWGVERLARFDKHIAEHFKRQMMLMQMQQQMSMMGGVGGGNNRPPTTGGEKPAGETQKPPTPGVPTAAVQRQRQVIT